jgi:adenosylcobinamide-GDP ribazoletransferase
MLTGLVTAVRTLSILPVPGHDTRTPASALYWFPAVGAGLGCAVWGASLAGRFAEPAWHEFAAALAVLVGVAVTRALHLDGLADWADAFAAMGGRQKRLAVMKDPAVGAFGAAAVATSILFKWCAITRLLHLGGARWILAAYVVSRAAQVELAGAYRYARDDGGTAARFVEEAGWPHRATSTITALAILAAAFGPAGLVAFAGGIALARLFGRWCRIALGGVTGDLLGAASEFVEIAILCACAFAGTWLADAAGGAWLLG